nr:PspC domain-containing protein [Turicibacter sp. H121]
MISGVCQGIADYFKMDATIIRLIWVVVTIFHLDLLVLFYI